MSSRTYHLRRSLAGIAVLFTLVVVSAALSPSFRSVLNLSNILVQASPLALVALGETLPILTEGIDLSVGSVISLATVLVATLSGHGLVWAIVAAVAMGAAVGLVNGIGVTVGRINPLIMTLATMTLVAGVALAILNQPGGTVPLGFENAMYAEVGVFSIPMAVMFVGMGVLAYLTLFTRFGRQLYATGYHEERARVNGIAVHRVKIMAYVISGVLASVAGIVLTGSLGSGDPNSGLPYTLTAIAAVVIGGTTLAGARGTVVGSVVGALVISVIANMLNQLNVNPMFQDVAQGILMIIALLAYLVPTVQAWRTRRHQEVSP